MAHSSTVRLMIQKFEQSTANSQDSIESVKPLGVPTHESAGFSKSGLEKFWTRSSDAVHGNEFGRDSTTEQSPGQVTDVGEQTCYDSEDDAEWDELNADFKYSVSDGYASNAKPPLDAGSDKDVSASYEEEVADLTSENNQALPIPKEQIPPTAVLLIQPPDPRPKRSVLQQHSRLPSSGNSRRPPMSTFLGDIPPPSHSPPPPPVDRRRPLPPLPPPPTEQVGAPSSQQRSAPPLPIVPPPATLSPPPPPLPPTNPPPLRRLHRPPATSPPAPPPSVSPQPAPSAAPNPGGTTREQRSLPEPPPLAALHSKPWFHQVSRETARALLRGGGDGAFLVRPCRAGGWQAPLALTVLYSGRDFNVIVRLRPDGRVALGSARRDELTFGSVEELVSHYQREPFALARGQVTRLLWHPPADGESDGQGPLPDVVPHSN